MNGENKAAKCAAILSLHLRKIITEMYNNFLFKKLDFFHIRLFLLPPLPPFFWWKKCIIHSLDDKKMLSFRFYKVFKFCLYIYLNRKWCNFYESWFPKFPPEEKLQILGIWFWLIRKHNNIKMTRYFRIFQNR